MSGPTLGGLGPGGGRSEEIGEGFLYVILGKSLSLSELQMAPPCLCPAF